MQLQIEEKYIYTVTDLNKEIRNAVLRRFPLLWVAGEISNLVRAVSGHLYFSIKDSRSQIRCAMFRNDNQQLQFELSNGLLVRLQAQPELYEPRGDLQLIVKRVEATGSGALQLEFERLKRKLFAEGLFDAALKKEIPAYPFTIGVITTPQGAALRDVIAVLRRRFPIAHLIVYPTLVQGATAAASLCRALQMAERRGEAEVLLLVRGGGSSEDLWAFNDEALARAIVACKLPIVSGIGHEIDFTIADFVCDRRAPTPSAAAAHISPDSAELIQELHNTANRLRIDIARNLKQKHAAVKLLATRLAQSHPKHQLHHRAQQLDDIHLRLIAAMKNNLHAHQQQLQHHHRVLLSNTPQRHLAYCINKLERHSQTLIHTVQNRLSRSQQNVTQLASTLDALGPTTTLQRGYAIVTDSSEGLISSVSQVSTAQAITIRVRDGRFAATVKER